MKQEDVSGLQKEIEILSKLRPHPQIVTLVGIKELYGEQYMLMEYMDGGDLLSYIRNNESSLQESDLFNVTTQIVDGMIYLEENKVIHRDLALRNVLCSIDKELIICKVRTIRFIFLNNLKNCQDF